MQYAFAFEKALFADTVRFEPKAASWLHGIAWQLGVTGTCPRAILPDKNFWLKAPAAQEFAPALELVSRPITQTVRPRAGTWKAAKPSVISTPSEPIASQALSHVVQKSAADPDSVAAQDLNKLFAARDKDLAWPSTNISQLAGYESTEPAALQGQ